MKIILTLLFAAQSIILAQSSGLFAFDNAVGRDKWAPEQQIRTLKDLGYDGISYNYTNPKDLAVWLGPCPEAPYITRRTEWRGHWLDEHPRA